MNHEVVNLAKHKKYNGKEANGNKGLKVYKVETAQQKEEARDRRNKTIKTFLIVLIIILAIAAIFSAINTFFPDLFGKFSLSGKLAAKVNGVPITAAQLDAEYARLPLQYQYFYTKEAFLKQLIDEVLLAQEASRQGFSVSQQEVDESLNTFMQENNVTPDKLNEVLVQKNLNYEQLRSLVKNQLLIEKLLAKEVREKANVTEEQALKYYNDNPETFRMPEMVTARHILIGLVNRTLEQSKLKAEEVLGMLKSDKSNFCDLVVLYSDDSGSNENCGEYTFPKGQMVPQFEDAAFNQGIGNISIVNTTFGYHLVWTTNLTLESVVPFSDVQEQITAVLQSQQEKMVYSDFITGLRGKAKITNYYEQELLEEQAKNATDATATAGAAVQESQEQQSQETAESAEAAAKTQVNVVASDETVEITELPEESVEAAEEQEEIGEEAEEAIEEVIEEEPAQAQPAELGFAECLKSKGAVLYGAYWDSSTKKQKEYFGVDAVNINYVECGIQGDYRVQAEICKEAGIQAYPTWVIGNDEHMGILDISQLSTITGCKV